MLSDILGMSGCAILHALVAGETNPERLADLTRGRLKASRAQMVDALTGRVTDHHRFLINLHLTHIESIETAVRTLEARIEETLVPFRVADSLLNTMPGWKKTVVPVVIAEVGTDMACFPSADYLVSWAGLCPRLDESAGKRQSSRTRWGTLWLKTTLVQAAWAAVRKKDSYFHAQFVRLKNRRGAKKAILAVAASMLTSAYYMLRDGVEFHDLGSHYFLIQRNKHDLTKRLLRQLRDVEVKNAA